jgi:hypothetical protein
LFFHRFRHLADGITLCLPCQQAPVHDELVFAVQALELVQLFLAIRGDGAGAAADRFAGQIEISADILEQGGGLRAQLLLQKSR